MRIRKPLAALAVSGLVVSGFAADAAKTTTSALPDAIASPIAQAVEVKPASAHRVNRGGELRYSFKYQSIVYRVWTPRRGHEKYDVSLQTTQGGPFMVSTRFGYKHPSGRVSYTDWEPKGMCFSGACTIKEGTMSDWWTRMEIRLVNVLPGTRTEGNFVVDFYH